MTRQELVLAVLAASDGAIHTPVQVQKLFFLLDQKIPTLIGGQRFKFKPLDYGPFDGEVYDELNALGSKGLVEVDSNGKLTKFRTTPQGQEQGKQILKESLSEATDYIESLSEWVRGLSFAELVSAIYDEYPAMKVNSAFTG